MISGGWEHAVVVVVVVGLGKHVCVSLLFVSVMKCKRPMCKIKKIICQREDLQ